MFNDTERRAIERYKTTGLQEELEAALAHIVKLEDRVRELETAQHWRPVTENDPPNGVWVQVGFPTGIISLATRRMGKWFGSDGLAFQYIPGANPQWRPAPPSAGAYSE